jgi:hypothetical protein
MNKENILKTIRNLKLEAKNPRNDGWVQSHYLNEIIEIKKECEEALKLLGKDKPSFKKKDELRSFKGFIDG